jgi:hypothetical protein
VARGFDSGMTHLLPVPTTDNPEADLPTNNSAEAFQPAPDWAESFRYFVLTRRCGHDDAISNTVYRNIGFANQHATIRR